MEVYKYKTRICLVPVLTTENRIVTSGLWLENPSFSDWKI